MRRRQLAVCDKEPEYIRRFAEYANRRGDSLFLVHGFTSCEELAKFTEENRADLVLLSPELFQGFGDARKLGRVILLSEEQEQKTEPEYPAVYKYQSCDRILRKLMDFCAEQLPSEPGRVLRIQELKLIGIYSPIRRTGKTSFALALGKELAKHKRTLYLNLEEYSGFQVLYPYEEGRTLSELLYFLKQGKNTFACKLESVVYRMGSLDYIPPLRSLIELRYVNIRDWENLLDALSRETKYEVLILDLGDAVSGLFELLDRCDAVYMPVKQDETACAKLSQYEDTLKLLALEEILDKTQKIEPFSGGVMEALVREEAKRWDQD